jgi:hypothetical protein
MHKIIIWIFNFLKDIAYFLKIVGIFHIMMMALYWIQNIIGAKWDWMNFIKPSLDFILSIGEKIAPMTFNVLDATLEFKYVSALLIIALWTFGFRFIYITLSVLQDEYEEVHCFHKKMTEKRFNNNLKKIVVDEEKKIKTFAVIINTRIKKKFAHEELHIDIEKFNKLMNNFIFENTGVAGTTFKDGFLYKFNDMENIDKVLSVFFRLLKDNTPIEYSISVQAGENIIQLAAIASFNLYGKIVLSADTLLRYKVNETHRYGTYNIGIFNNGENSLEIYEFQHIM